MLMAENHRCRVQIRRKGTASVAGDGLAGTHGSVGSSYLIIDSETRGKLASPCWMWASIALGEGDQDPQMKRAGIVRGYKWQGRRCQHPGTHLGIFRWHLLLQSQS